VESTARVGINNGRPRQPSRGELDTQHAGAFQRTTAGAAAAACHCCSSRCAQRQTRRASCTRRALFSLTRPCTAPRMCLSLCCACAAQFCPTHSPCVQPPADRQPVRTHAFGEAPSRASGSRLFLDTSGGTRMPNGQAAGHEPPRLVLPTGWVLTSQGMTQLLPRGWPPFHSTALLWRTPTLSLAPGSLYSSTGSTRGQRMTAYRRAAHSGAARAFPAALQI
jgi:hypothetical protein